MIFDLDSKLFWARNCSLFPYLRDSLQQNDSINRVAPNYWWKSKLDRYCRHNHISFCAYKICDPFPMDHVIWVS